MIGGELFFGQDIDHAFAFTTRKVVWVRNRWIGGLYYLFIASVILWLLLFRIIYRNDHFVRKDVTGVARMWYSHPTFEDCDSTQDTCLSNYTKLTNLPYCDEYEGPDVLETKSHCEFQGKISLVPGGSSDNELFITTAVEVITERRGCNPRAENGYACENEYEALNGTGCRRDKYLCRNRSGLTNQFFYVADATDYRIQFTSSYERDEYRGTSLMHRGHVCHAAERRAGQGPLGKAEQRTRRNWTERQSRKLEDDCDNVTLIKCQEGKKCPKPTRKFSFLYDTGIMAFFGFSRGDDSADDGQGGDGEGPPQQPADGPQVPTPREGPPRSRSIPLAHGPHDAAARSLLQMAQSTSSARVATATVQTARYSGTPREYSNQWGDTITLSRLLELAGVDLDRDFNMDGWSAREAGIALEVSAVYDNLYPIYSTFGYKPVRYHYQVRELMLPYVSRFQLSEVQPEDYPDTRRYEVRYGVLIHFKVAGTFGSFSVAFFLIMLSTAFALFATARTVTDKIALHIHPHRENFFHMKYEVSPDFSDMWKCSTCGFLNTKDVQYCQRVPRWQAPGETPACGAPRPPSPESSQEGPRGAS